VTGLEEAWGAIPAAVEETRGENDFTDLRKALEGRSLTIVGSGNSAYPSRYLEWRVRATLEARFCTPLEYVLEPPPQPHVCLLVSQGARRQDSLTVAERARRCGAPFFLLCARDALHGDTVAARIPRTHVFVTATGNERGFLNIVGTAAAFAAGHELAGALCADLAEPFPSLDLGALDDLVPVGGPVVVLHGPAARCAAEAFAGYHAESLGPIPIFDMKNFTHGVWRGLTEAGRHAVWLLADGQTMPLATTLAEALRSEHDPQIVSVAWPHLLAPFALYLVMTRAWMRRCEARAEAEPEWSPLSVDRARWKPFLELTAFDLATLT
jgi:hypothetical protein